MRILHIITGLGDGGAENTLYKVCKNDLKNDHIVISLTNLGKYHTLIKNLGIKVYNLDLKFYSFLKFLFLIKLIKSLRPDIIQTWLIMADLVGGIAGRFAGIKNIIWNIHFTNLKLDSTKLRNLIVIKLLAKLSFLIPKKTVVVSKSGIKNCRSLGYNNDKLIFIPNGYELNIFNYSKYQEDHFRKKLKIKENIPIFGNVARYDPIKDHKTLLQALSIIHSRRKPFVCVLVGSKMNIKNIELKEMIKKFDLDNNIKLLGTKRNITEIMNGLDVHILTSISEAFPNVVVEAMACKTPCISTNVGDCSSIMGNTGWLVPSKNPIKLAKVIENVITQIGTKSWNNRRNQSRLRIKQNYDIARMIKSLDNLWIKVANSNS
jgi:glycosyltransferase involved in cell wall biosynthesis